MRNAIAGEVLTHLPAYTCSAAAGESFGGDDAIGLELLTAEGVIAQIIGRLKQHEAGVKVADLSREHRISAPAFYAWKPKYGGLEASEAQRLRAMEGENRRLSIWWPT